MSGMLPGVECARRRRLHPREHTTRSFCLYAKNFQSQSPFSSSSLLERNMLNQTCTDENLGGRTREAKRRLDQKFMAHVKPAENKRKGLIQGLWRHLRS